MESPLSNTPITRKRKRLTHACNRCRARKVRCDEKYPRCTNCEKAGVDCATHDPRHPDATAERREAQKPVSLGVSLSTPRPQPNGYEHGHEENEFRGEAEELLPAAPRYAISSGNTFHTFCQWLDLASSRLGVQLSFDQDPLSAQPTPTKLLQSEDVDLIYTLSEDTIRESTLLYLRTANSAFPLLSETALGNMMIRWKTSYFRSREIRAESLLFMLIMGIGSSPKLPSFTKACLGFAMQNLHVLISSASLNAVQALSLMALLLRHRDDLPCASHLINLAASIGQSLGLHRSVSSLKSTEQLHQTLGERTSTWLSVYALEKIIAFEIGRPSSIRDCDCDVDALLRQDHVHSQGLVEVFRALISLAQLQSEIIEQFTASRRAEEETSNVEAAVHSKMEMVGELDQKLLQWLQLLPLHLRPQEQSTYDAEITHAATFLALQYQQTLFVLHRNALLIDLARVARVADALFQGRPYRYRFKNGRSICCAAARTIISTLDAALEADDHSVLCSSHSLLIAVYTLGVYLLGNPRGGLAHADFQIQSNGRRLVTSHQQRADISGEAESIALRTVLESFEITVATQPTGNSSSPYSMVSPQVTMAVIPESSLTALDLESENMMLDFNAMTTDWLNIDWNALPMV